MILARAAGQAMCWTPTDGYALLRLIYDRLSFDRARVETELAWIRQGEKATCNPNLRWFQDVIE